MKCLEFMSTALFNFITLVDTPSRHVITASLLTAFQDLYDFAALPWYGEIQKKKREKEMGKRNEKKETAGTYGHGATAGTMGAA